MGSEGPFTQQKGNSSYDMGFAGPLTSLLLPASGGRTLVVGVSYGIRNIDLDGQLFHMRGNKTDFNWLRARRWFPGFLRVLPKFME